MGQPMRVRALLLTSSVVLVLVPLGGACTSSTDEHASEPDRNGFDAASGEARAESGAGEDSGAASAAPDGGDDATAALARCAAPGLVWRTANKTNFTSYPDPNSEECTKYNGCAYEGEFAACDVTEPLAWVQTHDIVAVFPNLNTTSNGIGALALHDLCLKSGSKSIIVTVLDECADSDCSGCCTENKGSADQLIDVESFTDARWGVPDGPIQWADLGPTTGPGCK